MRTVYLALSFLGLAVSFAGADVTTGIYRGTSKTTVNYLNPNTLQTLATEIFARKETVTVGAPKKVGTQTEANPFSLNISPTPGTPAAVGEVRAASARVFSVSGGSVLVQYWSVQNTATGFTAQLANNHYADGLSKDKVIAKFGGPGGTPAAFKMHDGQIGTGLQCTLASTVTGRQMALKITGYAFVPGAAIIHFKTKITAQRSP